MNRQITYAVFIKISKLNDDVYIALLVSLAGATETDSLK